MNKISIDGRCIGDGEPVFIVGEMSANHDRDLNQALGLVDIAAQAGTDAIKLQTYTADSLTLWSSHPSVGIDPIWGAENLYKLYQNAAMPLEFHKPLFDRAHQKGLIVFSTVFDEFGVDYLERLDTPAYKVASPELVHLPLLRKIGQTGKPVILSTGMASLGEVEEALNMLVSAGTKHIVLLHCCSMYPADPAMVNLSAMQTLQQAFGYPVGFSDHTLGSLIPAAAAAMGACMIEKHFTNDSKRPGPDHRFSIDKDGLRKMVDEIRQIELAKGDGLKVITAGEFSNKISGRRSLFAAVDIPVGTKITEKMIAIVRPGTGLHPRFMDIVLGRVACRDVPAGWPLSWDDV